MQRPLLIGGFAGCGRSKVGDLVATRTGRPLIDLRKLVPDGQSEPPPSAPPRIQTGAAEEGHHLLGVVESTCEQAQAPIVLLGVDTLWHRDVRLAALDRCVVVSLHAPTETTLQRLGSQYPGHFSGPEAAQHLAQQLELRAAAYAECHRGVVLNEADVSATADEVVAIWKRNPLAVAAGNRSYAVDVGDGVAVSQLRSTIEGASTVLLVSDSNVEPLHADKIRQVVRAAGLGCATVVLPAGEQHKNIETLSRIWQQALLAEADRRSVVVALGGGVVTDMAGFAASAWMRGIRWVAVSTTLLGMVDAAVGGKTAVDLLAAKNAVGAFWQPSAVLCDTSLLCTEPKRGYRSALAEVVKTALIGDSRLLDLLESHCSDVRERDPELVAEIVRRCVRVKARVVSLDEREGGLRAVLNLGHTVGHALEAAAEYTGLTHGEAISLGLVAALRLGRKLGTTPSAVAERTELLLERLGLPVRLDRAALTRAAALVGHDKKRAGKTVRLVLVREAGRVEPLPVPIDDLRRWTMELTA